MPRINNVYTETKDGSYEGLILNTDDGEYKIVIESGQFCCENYGFKVKIMRPSDDIGNGDITPSELIDVGADILLNQNIIGASLYRDDLDIDSLIEQKNSIHNTESASVKLVTESETYLIMLYNEHNGYYSHRILITWPGYEYEGFL